ncbi:Uncharacterised protein [Mycobacterium tuberculosis]|nr:Uncharacterised protein [Mycobacterium tuberculosis]
MRFAHLGLGFRFAHLGVQDIHPEIGVVLDRIRTHVFGTGRRPRGCSVAMRVAQWPRVLAKLGPGLAPVLRGGLGPARLGLRPVHGSRWLFGNLLGDWFRRRLWGSFANLDSPVSRRRLARVRVRAGVVMVVTNDRNLTGQLGDRDGVTIAASPPAPSGRGAGDPLPGQQLGHRDLPVTGALCFGVWSRHGLLPLDRLAAFRSAG